MLDERICELKHRSFPKKTLKTIQQEIYQIVLLNK